MQEQEEQERTNNGEAMVPSEQGRGSNDEADVKNEEIVVNEKNAPVEHCEEEGNENSPCHDEVVNNDGNTGIV